MVDVFSRRGRATALRAVDAHLVLLASQLVAQQGNLVAHALQRRNLFGVQGLFLREVCPVKAYANFEVTRPALRYHGAKFRLAPWILRHFPQHHVYTEAFGGAAGVLLHKERSHGEVYNDLDGDVVNFFQVLRDPGSRAELEQLCMLTPYAREEFELAWEPTPDPLERARRLAIRAQMGFGSAGATKGSTGLRTDLKRRFTTAQQDWAAYPAAIAAAGARFAGVLIENRPAVDVLQQHDGATTLHFVDPPYMHETRVIRASGGYRHELSDDDHEDLLEALLPLQGMVVVSGYETEIYNDLLRGWQTHRTASRISGGRGTAVRTEVVWLNPACQQALASGHGGLFAAEASP
jgi:DNA adenine methylase